MKANISGRLNYGNINSLTRLDYEMIKKIDISDTDTEADGYLTDLKNADFSVSLLSPNRIAKYGLKEGELFLLQHIVHLCKIHTSDGSKWKLSKKHLQTYFEKIHCMKKKAFNNRWNGLKNKGFLWQFRIPVNNGKSKGRFIYLYQINLIPNLQYVGCIDCNADGKPIPKSHNQGRPTAEQAKVINEMYKEQSKIIENKVEQDIKAQETVVPSNKAELSGKMSVDFAEQIIKSNIGYTDLLNTESADKQVYDKLLNAMFYIFGFKYAKYKVNGILVRTETVQQRILQVNQSVFLAVVDKYKDLFDKSDIKKERSYLITMLYNAVKESEKIREEKPFKPSVSAEVVEYIKDTANGRFTESELTTIYDILYRKFGNADIDICEFFKQEITVLDTYISQNRVINTFGYFRQMLTNDKKIEKLTIKQEKPSYDLDEFERMALRNTPQSTKNDFENYASKFDKKLKLGKFFD